MPPRRKTAAVRGGKNSRGKGGNRKNGGSALRTFGWLLLMLLVLLAVSGALLLSGPPRYPVPEVPAADMMRRIKIMQQVFSRVSQSKQADEIAALELTPEDVNTLLHALAKFHSAGDVRTADGGRCKDYRIDYVDGRFLIEKAVPSHIGNTTVVLKATGRLYYGEDELAFEVDSAHAGVYRLPAAMVERKITDAIAKRQSSREYQIFRNAINRIEFNPENHHVTIYYYPFFLRRLVSPAR